MSVEDVDPKGSDQDLITQTFLAEVERLTAIDAQWRKYFASPAEATDDPKKPESPSFFLSE